MFLLSVYTSGFATALRYRDQPFTAHGDLLDPDTSKIYGLQADIDPEVRNSLRSMVTYQQRLSAMMGVGCE